MKQAVFLAIRFSLSDLMTDHRCLIPGMSTENESVQANRAISAGKAISNRSESTIERLEVSRRKTFEEGQRTPAPVEPQSLGMFPLFRVRPQQLRL
jgi:hypothetical protein